MEKSRKSMLVTFILATLIVGLFFGRSIFLGFRGLSKSITGNALQDPNLLSNLLIPSAVTSLLLSIIGLITIILLVIKIRSIGVAKTFPFKNYVISISIIFVIYIINYLITLFPYGNIAVVIINLVLQIMIYGILLPYILVAQIGYICLILRGDIRDILK